MSKEFYVGLGKTTRWPTFPPQFPPPTSITYDDVLLVPGSGTEIESRRQPNLSVQFGPYTLRTPIVSAPMDTVSGERMIRKLADLGAIGSLPRNNNFAETLSLCEQFSRDNIPCLYALGLENAFEQASQLKERGAGMILLDVAHGGMGKVARTAGDIKDKLDMFIVAGNIVTYEQASTYKKVGVDIARVGVGPGGACTTRLVAGSGFPQLSAIFETTETGIYVIADGGIRYPGDMAKALAAGANSVMIGSAFAGTEETPGEIHNGYKRFRGQASTSYMKDNGTQPGEFRAAEGIETDVLARGSVEQIINEMTGGVRSAMSYTGAQTIQEFQKKALFTFVSSAAQAESRPHIIK